MLTTIDRRALGRDHMRLHGAAIRRRAIEAVLDQCWQRAKAEGGTPEEVFCRARELWHARFRELGLRSAAARQRHRAQPAIHPVVETGNQEKGSPASCLARDPVGGSRGASTLTSTASG